LAGGGEICKRSDVLLSCEVDLAFIFKKRLNILIASYHLILIARYYYSVLLRHSYMNGIGSPPPSLSVLYVDDEPALLEIGKLFLQRSGEFVVSTCESAPDAIRLLSESSFDAIISDYQMPEMDGIQFLQHLRQHGNTTPFIIFTGKGREDVVAEALNSGVDFYLQKGGDPKLQFAELSNKIRYAVARRRFEAGINRRLQFERLIRTISSRFVSGGDFDPTLMQVLEDIGLFCGASRSYIFQLGDDGEVMDNTHEWCADGVAPEIRNLPCSLVSWWMEKLRNDEVIRIRDLEDLPPEASSEKKLLQAQGIASVIVLPLTIRQALAGFIGLDNVEAARDWTEDDIRILRISGEIIGGAIERKRAEEALQKSEERYRRISENAPVGIFQLAMAPSGEFSFPYLSSKVTEITGVPVEEFYASFRAVHDRIHPDYLDLFEGAILESADRLEDFHQTLLYCAGDGYRWLEVRSTPSKQEDGTILWEGVIIDVDQQKKAEEALRRTNDELSAANESLTAAEEEIRQQLDDLTLAQQEIRESEEQFRQIFETMNEGMALHEIVALEGGEPDEYRILAANPSFERILGIDRHSIIGKLSRDVYGTDEPPYLQKYVQVAQTGVPDSFETYFPPFDKYFRISVYPPRKNQFATIFEDITERKRGEEALRESEEKFRNLVENLNEIFYVLDEKATIKYISRNIESISGYPASEVIGRSYIDFIHPDDRTGRILQFRSILSGSNEATEYRFLKADGGSVWVKTAARPILREGRVVGIQGMLTDITGLKTMEAALRESEEQYRDLADNAPIGILTCDTEGRIAYVNQRGLEILGSPGEEETRGINLLTFPSLVQIGFAEMLRKTMSSGVATPATEGEYRTKWGKSAHYRVNFSPILNQGTVAGARIILDDISEHKKSEDALNIANKKLQLLSGITRHDILNQIMVIQGYLDLAKDLDKDPTLSEFCDYVGRAAATIRRQIEFTREYEQLGLKKPAWLSLGGMIEENEDPRLPIRYDCPEVSIYADPMIEKVFSNLMDNTIRHAEGATGVRVRCSKSGSGLMITWEDDGPGVPDDQKERIFERGFGRNTGLGLFLAREILGITGIAIAETGVYGEGARFEMLVPEGGYRIDA